jgi:Transposase DDE domain
MICKYEKNIAARGKTSVDWFFGLKLHLVINDKGELLNFQVTPGNVDDRKPVPDLLQHLFGKVFADKGYISQKLFEELMNSVGVQVITKLKRNMKQRLMSLGDRLLLRKRAVVETVIDQLKNISQIEHSRQFYWFFIRFSSSCKASTCFRMSLILSGSDDDCDGSSPSETISMRRGWVFIGRSGLVSPD